MQMGSALKRNLYNYESVCSPVAMPESAPMLATGAMPEGISTTSRPIRSRGVQLVNMMNE